MLVVEGFGELGVGAAHQVEDDADFVVGEGIGGEVGAEAKDRSDQNEEDGDVSHGSWIERCGAWCLVHGLWDDRGSGGKFE